MTTVTVSKPRSYMDRGWPAVSARVTVEGDPFDIYIRSSRGPLSGSADPFLALALLPAMKLGADLHINGGVSPRLLKSVAQIQDIIVSWFKEYSRVTITVHGSDGAPQARPEQAAGFGCFFSGGIDSSYSALKHAADITHLVFVHGFDIRVSNTARLRQVSPAIESAAQLLHKPLVTVETNARSLLDVFTRWGEHSCGAGLASVALALSPQLGVMYIAASDAYPDTVPWGSHPLTDPLWSSDLTQIIHDGCEANRWQKLESLAAAQTALQWLRVCSKAQGGVYNCCRCRKCIETMICLEAVGALARSRTFTQPPDLDALLQMDLGPGDAVYTARLLATVEKHNARPALANALRESLRRCAEQYGTGVTPAQLLAQDRSAILESQLRQAERHVSKLKAQLHAMQTSRSWRLTAPLRRAGSIVRQWNKKDTP